jgi:hypothetical protein
MRTLARTHSLEETELRLFEALGGHNSSKRDHSIFRRSNSPVASLFTTSNKDTAGSYASESEDEHCTKSNDEGRLRESKRSSAVMRAFTRKQRLEEIAHHLLETLGRQNSPKRGRSVGRKSLVASISESNGNSGEQETIKQTESQGNSLKSADTEKNTPSSSESTQLKKPESQMSEKTHIGAETGLCSISGKPENLPQQNAQNMPTHSSDEIIGAISPGRKRKRSASRSPSPENALLARRKRQRTSYCTGRKKLDLTAGSDYCTGRTKLNLTAGSDYCTGRKKLNLTAGSDYCTGRKKLNLTAGSESSEDIYDFDSSEETIPISLACKQDVASSNSAEKVATGLVSPKIGKKLRKNVKKSETLQQDPGSFLSPFTSPTPTNPGPGSKPVTPFVAGIFCNSPAFGGVEFVEDEDHVDAFGYVDDSSSEAESDDDLLGSISQRIGRLSHYLYCFIRLTRKFWIPTFGPLNTNICS